MVDRARIAALNVYPVKSCRGIASASLELARTGFLHDRHWLIVRPNGRFITQRELPRLALIETALLGDAVRLSAPGMPAIDVVKRPGSPSMDVVIWRDACRGIDQGEGVSAWLTEFLGEQLRLVAFDETRERPSNREWTGETHAVTEFSDGFALMTISENSLADLNGRLKRALPMDRFRPNIVLAGIDAYDEDRIHELWLDGLRLRAVKPCIRCSITTTNQLTAEVEGDEPLRTLKAYRWSKPLLGVAFGQNLIVVDGAGRALRVGDELEISWRT
jgi:uncharacterized protein YcbX